MGYSSLECVLGCVEVMFLHCSPYGFCPPEIKPSDVCLHQRKYDLHRPLPPLHAIPGAIGPKFPHFLVREPLYLVGGHVKRDVAALDCAELLEEVSDCLASSCVG